MAIRQISQDLVNKIKDKLKFFPWMVEVLTGGRNGILRFGVFF